MPRSAPDNCMASVIRNDPTQGTFWRDVVSEFLATFFLMSVQCALPLAWPDQPSEPVRIGLGMGFIVCTMAWSLGDFGGGHMNPAVTIAMCATCKITIVRAVLYIAAQCCGAMAGAGFIYAVTPENSRGNLGATTLGPGMKNWQGFLVELWITCILVITILGSTNAKRKNSLFMPTIPIGFAISLGIMAGIGYTGGSMNPARSLGPAVVMKIWDDHWVYWAGPIAGGLLAALFYSVMLDKIGKSDSVSFDPDVNPRGSWSAKEEGTDNKAYNRDDNYL